MEPPGRAGDCIVLLKDLFLSQRVRHALIAAALATMLGALGILGPFEGQIRAAQALSTPRQASGDVVFVGATDDLNDPLKSRARTELAALIRSLSQAGARQIFLNIVLDRQSTPEADGALGNAISQSGRTVLVQRYMTTAAGDRVRSTIPQISGTAPQVISKEWVDPFGYTWSAPYSAVAHNKELRTLPVAIAGRTGPPGTEFLIDYSIDYRSIPKFTVPEAMAALAAYGRSPAFEGKIIVIGNGGEHASTYASIPGHWRVPASIIAILAGETLIAKPPFDIGWFPPLALLTICILLVILVSKRPRQRHVGYALVAGLIPAFFFAFAFARVAADLGVPLTFLGLFTLLRLWGMRLRRALYVDELSGLPSFRRLANDLSRGAAGERHAVVVAKLHRFDEVLSSLPSDCHGEYVRLVACRFRITDPELVVYSNGGRYLAWLQIVEDQEQLEVHLRGLRAVFAQPLQIGGSTVDVGITFAADATREEDAMRKIAAAAAAVERTTEAHAPVLMAQESTETDRRWSISLQAKIDEALKSGAIYVVYQPQFDLTAGALVGAEALVRWNDPDRGQIPPSYFIEQCEHSGRMDALTRKVLEDAVHAVSGSTLRGARFQLSVNVSATLLHDFRLADMLTQVLSSASLPASRLTLEITETSRITDYELAHAVMDRLHQIGARLSIDDFGVGAASLETLLQLPFDELKIDRMFVSRARHDAKAKEILKTLVMLSHNLNMVVVAEGVEDVETLEILKNAGCDAAQGYLLGRPKDCRHLITEHGMMHTQDRAQLALR